MGRAKIFKEIMLYEERFSTLRCVDRPADLETSLIGHDISALLETVSGVESLQPYTDVSVRMLMSMADLLMSFYHCHCYDLLATQFDGIVYEDEIRRKQRALIQRRHAMERDFWYDSSKSYVADMDEEDRLRHE